MPSLYKRAMNWLTDTPTERVSKQVPDPTWSTISDILGGSSLDGSKKTALSSERWLQEFHTNPRLAALNKLVNDTGVSDFGIYEDHDKNGKTTILNHPLQLELEAHTVPMFFSLWTAYRYMVGEVYIAFDSSSTGPKNFKVFTSTHLVKPVEGGDYTFQYGNKQITYKEKNVIRDLDLNLRDPYHTGYGRAGAIMAELESDTIIQSYLSSFYTNSARADIYISPKGVAGEVPSSDELKNLASQLRQFHQGLENAHKTAVLSFAADVQSAPNNHMEMELLDTRRFLRDTAIQHFSIPPEIMGIIENSNKATVVAAEHIYAKQVRLPLLRHFQDIINSKLLPLYKHSEGMYFEFYDILPDDFELNVQIAKEGREGKSLTINEHRALLGFPRLADEVGNRLILSGEGEEDAEVVVVLPSTRDNDKHKKNFKELTETSEAKTATGGVVGDIHEKFIIVEGEINEDT